MSGSTDAWPTIIVVTSGGTNPTVVGLWSHNPRHGTWMAAQLTEAWRAIAAVVTDAQLIQFWRREGSLSLPQGLTARRYRWPAGGAVTLSDYVGRPLDELVTAGRMVPDTGSPSPSPAPTRGSAAPALPLSRNARSNPEAQRERETAATLKAANEAIDKNRIPLMLVPGYVDARVGPAIPGTNKATHMKVPYVIVCRGTDLATAARKGREVLHMALVVIVEDRSDRLALPDPGLGGPEVVA